MKQLNNLGRNNIREFKVDVIVRYFHPVIAGIEIHCLEIYKLLGKEKKYNVTIHTSKDTLIEKNILESYERVENINVTRYNSNILNFVPKIDYKNTDIIHLHNFNIFPHFWIFSSDLLLKITGQKNHKTIITLHGGFNPRWDLFPLHERIIKRVYHNIIGRFILNHIVDNIIAVSEWEKLALQNLKINRSKITVIGNGIEDIAYENPEEKIEERITKKVEKMEKYILQIGRISPIKNQELVIKSLPYMPDNIKYVIAGTVGDAKYYQKLLRLIEKLNLKEKIVFYGGVYGYEKYYLIKKSICKVHLSFSECDPIVIKETLSQGTICIVSNRDGLPYLIRDGENGFVISIDNEEKAINELIVKINFILDNKNKPIIHKMMNKNISEGKAFNLNYAIEKINTIYL